jgi:hypothetical protein
MRVWTLECMNNLGDSFTQAVEHGERLVGDCEQLLGGRHRHTLNARNNLAYAYRMTGRPAKAIELYERTLPGHERVLGPGHPDTTLVRISLPTVFAEATTVAEVIRYSNEPMLTLSDC